MNEYLTATSSLAPYMVFPRFLIDSEVNGTSMILYMLLLDRARLSLRSNKWTDSLGHTFLYYPVKSLAETLHKSEMTIKTSLAALEKADLITRVKQGAGIPLWGNVRSAEGCPVPQAERTIYSRYLMKYFFEKGIQDMAIYHLEAKVISRGIGRSVVAAAAYMACSKLYNNYDGIEHDYTRKHGLVHQEIILPPNAPKEWADREKLWNAVEETEKTKDSRLAREFVAALPVELSKEAWIDLLRQYINKNFVSEGMCADFAIHDTDGHNPHAHIILTVRPLDENGSTRQKKNTSAYETGRKKALPQRNLNRQKIMDGKSSISIKLAKRKST